MFGPEMMMKALGLNPDEVKGTIASVAQNAEMAKNLMIENSQVLSRLAESDLAQNEAMKAFVLAQGEILNAIRRVEAKLDAEIATRLDREAEAAIKEVTNGTGQRESETVNTKSEGGSRSARKRADG